MAMRYSIRQTPRKKELEEGLMEFSDRRVSSRGKTQFVRADILDGDADTSSAAEIKPCKHRSRKASPTMANSEPVEAQLLVGSNRMAEKMDETGYEKPLLDGRGPRLDVKIDHGSDFEFGGSWGTGCMMIGFPLLMWYMWIGATYYDGGFPGPGDGQSWSEFGKHLVNLVYTGAFPHAKAWIVYWTFLVFEGFCYVFLPGVHARGKPLPHEGGKQLPYYCSGFVSFYVTIAVAAALHFSGLFPLYFLIDEFGPLLSVAIISGWLVSVVAYVSAHVRGATHRMTGSLVYDFFMGAELNPRIFGILDLKMFFEVRLPWYMLFLLSCGTAARQYERYGYVSYEVCFIVLAHFLYANACGKGEELIVTTWDMYFEKWGFMLIFWNMAGVPLSYCHCTIFLANHHPDEYHHSPWAMAGLTLAYLLVYYVWDTCNSQKNRFRAMERNTLVHRNTFPQFSYQTLHDPKFLKTPDGATILVDGWYAKARKIHYTCDVFFSFCWGLVTGYSSFWPWFYFFFFCAMILHRTQRDIAKCRKNYGKTWEEYEKLVPYLFIPYVY